MKKVCGIVAEYNPFHNGHRYHIEQTRALLGEDTAIVCVMSGNFVQRGEPAVFLKHARAEAALRCGADLVLELPLPWAMATAEAFARGAVALLAASGVVTHLGFGSESGDLAALDRIAELLLRPEMDPLIRDSLAVGLPYAAARQRAAETLAGEPLEPFCAPNNILGIEYLKALRASNLPMTPVTVLRRGAGHDESGTRGEYPSAAFLRQRLTNDRGLAGQMPDDAYNVFARETEQGRGPVLPAALETALLSRLRMLPLSAFAALPDAGEGLENRLYRAAREEATADAVLAAAVSKRYTRSRLRRMLWAAALGLRGEDAEGAPPYLRVLAANAWGRELLARMRKTASLPVITKPVAVRALDARAQRVFGLEADAADLYALAFSAKEARRGGQEWRRGPIML